MLNDEMQNYEVGDLMWPKQKSHTWCLDQSFDAAYASAKAKGIGKSKLHSLMYIAYLNSK